MKVSEVKIFRDKEKQARGDVEVMVKAVVVAMMVVMVVVIGMAWVAGVAVPVIVRSKYFH